MRRKLRSISSKSGVTSKRQTSLKIADRVESAIREKIVFLAGTPGAGHSRKDLTDEDVKFFPVYSYLIAYRPQTKPFEVVAILHGRRDVERIQRPYMSDGSPALAKNPLAALRGA